MINNENRTFVPFPAVLETRELALEVLMERAEHSSELIRILMDEFFENSDDQDDIIEDFKFEIQEVAVAVMNDIDDLKSGMDALTLDRTNGKGKIYEREVARVKNSDEIPF